MTGLEKIIEQIKAQSKLNCDEIISEANRKAKEILIEARNKAEILSKEIISQAEITAESKNRLAKISAENITRNRYLEVRNAIMNDVLSAAYEEIEKLSDEEYFNMLIKICTKNIVSGECTMFLNSFDLSRLPEDFQDTVNSEVYEIGAVHISDEPIDIENGFILNYGDFEVNCTFRAIFDEKMDELKDMLNLIFFDRVGV